MPTGAEEIVGTAIGVVGLLAAFKGAVDGYLLVESFFAADNGLRDLALDYRIECEKLKNWGDRFNVHAEREEDCLLYHEKRQIKILMAEIFGRIEELHKQADKFVERHGASGFQVDYSDLPTTAAQFHKQLQLHSEETKAMSIAQMSKEQRKKIKWAIKNKEKFGEVVQKLRKANEDLLGLLSEPSLATFKKALPGYVLASLSSPEQLRQAHDIQGAQNNLIRQAAQLKILQTPGSKHQDPTMIDYYALSPVKSGGKKPSSRNVSIYNLVARVWVEWLDIEHTFTSDAEHHQIRERIKTLSVMLQSAPEPFRVATCIGCLEDPATAFRLGLVYQVPLNESGDTPISLLHIISKRNQFQEPPLGDKFKLAQKLATTLMQLHASNWLHKAFRSDNVLFFMGDTTTVARPYLAGFEYARDVSMQSIGFRPTGMKLTDYYYHPGVVNGFSKTLDWYSLGVVLMEIAFWRPLHSKIPEQNAQSLEAIHQLFCQTADRKLDAVVGNIYANVVRTCLNGALPDAKEDAEFACAMNNVVLQLEQCRA